MDNYVITWEYNIITWELCNYMGVMSRVVSDALTQFGVQVEGVFLWCYTLCLDFVILYIILLFLCELH